jgi:tetratricopeptide (TPR) repeat protein
VSGRRRIAASPGGPGGDAKRHRLRRPPWFLPLIVFTVAAAVRLLAGATLWDLPLVRTPKLDSAEYLSWATRLADGNWAWPAVAQHGPGYPVFLAALLVLGSGSLKTALVLQALVCSGTASLIAVVARRWYGARAGLLAGLVYAVYGPAVYIDTVVLSEGPLLFLLAAALWMLARDSISTPWAIAAGAAFGAATLIRPTAITIAMACALWLLMIRRRRAAAVLCLATTVVMAPVLAKSWSTSGVLSIQGYGGLNAYIGNSPLHDGRATFRIGAGWDALNSEAPRAGIADPVAQDRYYLTKTWREVAQHPWAFARLLGMKALWLIQSEESRDSHSYYFFTDQSALLGLLPRFALLFPLSCIGAFVIAGARATNPKSQIPNHAEALAALLACYTLGAAAGVVLLVVGLRYRMPLVLPLAIAAGAGADAIISAAVARRWRELAGFAFVAVVAVAVSHTLSDRRNTNLAEEWALTGSSLVTEHRLDEAEAAYRHAVDLDPQSSLAWDGLGLTLYDAARLAEAMPAFERAIAIDRDNSHAIFHVALVQDREGQVAQAVDGYARALALSPFDADITTHLGEAKRKLAVQLGMAGRTSEAREAMRQAVQLMPDNGEAWLDLCLLSLDLGDRFEAAGALERARAHGANPDRLAFAANALAR